MKTVLVSIVGIVLMLFVILISSYISANNYGAKTESLLKAAREDNMNILAQYEQRVLEVVQVPEMYKNDLKEVVRQSMEGRYGANGSQAVFQWIQENNLNFDSSIYTRIQDTIVGGRKDFEVGQRRMLDIRQGYEAQLNFAWRGLWLRIAGYPKLDLSQYVPVITQRTSTTFERGMEDSPLKLR